MRAKENLVPYRSPEKWNALIRIATREKRSAALSVSVDRFCEQLIDQRAELAGIEREHE